MEQPGRLRGVDLLRALAAYGVVSIHSLASLPAEASTVYWNTMFLGFVVPYFLATAFYFDFGRLQRQGTLSFLRSRFDRLLIPYLVWSALFVALRCGLYAATSRPDATADITGRPFEILFLGKAAAPLYFIPLLFMGELLAVLLVAEFGDRLRDWRLVSLLAALSLILACLDPLRYDPALKDPALSSAAKVSLTLFFYLVWCCPFVALALVFRLEPVGARIRSIPWPLAVLLAVSLLALDSLNVLHTIDGYWGPVGREPFLAFGALTLGIAVSDLVPQSRWLDSLAACSFGIFLMHPFVIETLELVLARSGAFRGLRTDAPIVATFALLVFLLSWAFVAGTMRVPLLARFLYGVPVRTAPQTRRESTAG